MPAHLIERPTPPSLAGEPCWHCSRPLPALYFLTYDPPGDDYEPARFCSLACSHDYADAYGFDRPEFLEADH